MLRIRDERDDERPVVRSIVTNAFGQAAEANLVDALRRPDPEVISLVAELDGTVVGHILFSPVELDPANGTVRIASLAPLAVNPEHQNRGIGQALVAEGLRRCEERGYHVVVVLGHPEYYARFGFVPAHSRGLTCAFAPPGESYRVIELALVLDGEPTSVVYPTPFHQLE